MKKSGKSHPYKRNKSLYLIKYATRMRLFDLSIKLVDAHILANYWFFFIQMQFSSIFHAEEFPELIFYSQAHINFDKLRKNMAVKSIFFEFYCSNAVLCVCVHTIRNTNSFLLKFSDSTSLLINTICCDFLTT